MIGIVIVSHSARLAEGVVELARQMGGEDAPLAAAGGIDDPDDPIGTDAFAIKEAIESVWSDDGVLVLMDLGSAIMNAETALEFLEPPADAARVLLCEAPLVEGAVAAAATARLGSSLSEVAAEARAGLTAKIEHLAPEEAPASEVSLDDDARTVQITVSNRLGLHLRPAGRLVEALGRFDARTEVRNVTTGAGPAPGRSLSRVSALGIRAGHVMEVRAQGREADQALQAVEELAARNFGDRDGEAPTPAPVPRPADVTDGTVRGVGAAPGRAVGPARHLSRPALEVPERPFDGEEEERRRLEAALAAVRDDVSVQREAVQRAAGAEEAEIFSAHLLILDDEEIAAAAFQRIEEGATAEQAWQETIREAAAAMRKLDEPYQAERAADVEAVGHQVLGRLLGVEPAPTLTAEGILVAPDLTPGVTATLDTDLVMAIVTEGGAPTSHSAILARALGIPAVVAVGEFDVAEGTMLLVDGGAGTIEIDPDEATVASVRRQNQVEAERRNAARQQAMAPAATTDGTGIEVAANIGSRADAVAAAEAGADAVGLFRTEFLYLNRREPPGEDEQEATYRSVAEALAGRPVVLRTLDVGGDKPLPFIDRPEEANPFLGVRGLRLGLERPDLLMTQLRAALRVARDHPLRIMFPMVTELEEWRRAREMVDEAAGGRADFEVGVMVEVPALALTADHLAAEVDFFSVGTNDLTQYALAAERGNPALAGMADGLHPAVLRLIEMTCRAASHHGRWVGVCGELAGDPAAIPVLLGLGVTELSMNPVAIPAAKQVVRRTSLTAARDLAIEALSLPDADSVRRLVARARYR